LSKFNLCICAIRLRGKNCLAESRTILNQDEKILKRQIFAVCLK
jgi:hypothetical protein